MRKSLNIIDMVKEIRSLSSGTVARLCGSPRYDDIDQYTSEWVQWVLSHGVERRWRDWVHCHAQYERHNSQLLAPAAMVEEPETPEEKRQNVLTKWADCYLFEG